MSCLWKDLYAHRLDWAEEAYIGFLKEISPDKVEEFRNHTEVSVTVYGSTQVGKTTLILKLIGISDDSLKTVTEVLRGGRIEGKSSTATVIQYSRSPNNNWYLDDQQFSTENIVAEFRDLRFHVENGSYKTDAPINLKIPNQYFTTEKPTILVKILDLPGTHAANEYEVDHVNSLIQRYIPHVDLVLLVGKADDLGFLTSEKLTLESLRSWHLKKNSQYRVILTHTISPDSFIRWIGKQAILSKENIRGYLYEEFHTHDYSERISSDSLEYIYPLEYGDSWETLEENNNSVFTKINPIMDEIFSDLITDISSSATEHGRIKRAFVFHHEVEVEHAEISKNEVKKIEIEEELIKKIINRMSRIDSYIDQQETMIKNYENNDKELLKLCDEVVFKPEPFVEKEESVIALKSWINKIQNQIIHKYREHLSNIYNRQYNISTEEKSEIEKNFNIVKQKLEKYWTDTYYIADNFNKDKNMIEIAQKEAIHYVEEKFNKHIDTLKLENKQKINTLFMRIENFKIRQQQYKKILDTKESEFQDILKKWEYKRIELNSKYKKSQNFISHLWDAFSEEIKQVYSDIENTFDPADIFFKLCYIQLLHKEFDTLTHGE